MTATITNGRSTATSGQSKTQLGRYQKGGAALELLRESTRYHNIDRFNIEFRRRFGSVLCDSTFYRLRKEVREAADRARAEAISGAVQGTTVIACSIPEGSDSQVATPTTRRRRSESSPKPDYATALEHACLVAELSRMSGGLEAIEFLIQVQDEVGGPSALGSIVAELRRFQGIDQIRRVSGPTRKLPDAGEWPITPIEEQPKL